MSRNKCHLCGKTILALKNEQRSVFPMQPYWEGNQPDYHTFVRTEGDISSEKLGYLPNRSNDFFSYLGEFKKFHKLGFRIVGRF